MTVPFPEGVPLGTGQISVGAFRNSSADWTGLCGFMRVKRMTGQKEAFGTNKG